MTGQMAIKWHRKIAEYIFFGNYFYGVCAAALSAEAMLQQRFPLNGFLYFFLIFVSTILYYTYPYVRKCLLVSSNSRTNWYSRNYRFVQRSQVVITVILIFSLAAFLKSYWRSLLDMPAGQWFFIIIFPAAAAWYYGIGFFNLRKTGWLKPFVIGFIWAGLVTVYPVLFYCIVNNISYSPNQVSVLLFLKNLMFVAVLCIMFDVKDYAADYVSRLKTFVVGMGLRKTIFYILLPLSALGLLSFVYYALTRQFHMGKLLLNVIPFVLLIAVVFSLKKRRPLMYYLVVVDGLMLVKALCGTIAMLYF
jgi:hypothetical protein